jgi:hypothetical protein
MTYAAPFRRPTTVVMVPSCAGGIGHISRCAALAGTLQRLDPTIRVEFVLDTERLRPFNIEATARMGFQPRLLAPRTRESRDDVVQACFGEADVIVDDVARYLLPLRSLVPHAAWISILMHPVGDELFMDWPLMAQMEALIWPYPSLMGMPAELAPVADKVVRTGPFLLTGDVPDRAACRARLGRPGDRERVLYAPRGFPFGREFGHRVLAAVYGAVAALRATTHPHLELELLAVTDPAELRGIAGVPDALPDWVRLNGVVTPQQSLVYTRASNIVVAEGTSTMHEAAALRTPLVLVPGPIQEATLLARCLDEHRAADIFTLPSVTPETFATAFRAILADGPSRTARTERAYELVTGGGGVEAAARLVLEVAERQRSIVAARRRHTV